MQRILAIAGLTMKAAFRFRLVIVLAVILLGSVVALPLVIKDDATARGFTQIVLTYTLTLTTALLGFSTLWLACGTLARDIEESQMQMVAVKPVSRWEIWMGKLLGIMGINAILLSLACSAVFALLLWRSDKLPENEKEVLRNEVLVARASARPPVPEIEPQVDEMTRDVLKQNPSMAAEDAAYVRQQIRERVRSELQAVGPDTRIEWHIDLGSRGGSLKDKPMSLRFKFNAAVPTGKGTYPGRWVVGGWESPTAFRSELLSLSGNTFHELRLPPNLVGDDGRLTLDFVNRSQAVLLFPLDEGVEVLYPEGGFALNYARGVAVIFFWLTLMAALGLAAASFLSFPVAAFFSMGLLVVGLSSGTISQVIEQGTVLEVNHETGRADKPAWIDHVALPIFKVLLKLINLVQGFSPIDSLSTGRSVSWSEVGLAFGQVCVILGGCFAALGIFTFSRRELATAQGTQ